MPELSKIIKIVEVVKNGDVFLTQRNARVGTATMLFKTKENGGRYPVVAEAFTRIVERIIRAVEKQEKAKLS